MRGVGACAGHHGGGVSLAVQSEGDRGAYGRIGGAGDISPEGILFIEAKNSPSKKPLVIVSYEVSGTVAIFELIEN